MSAGNENGTGLTRAGAADSAHGNPFELFDRAQGTNEVSAAQPETPDQRLVTADARPLEIVQQTSPLADHDEQPAPRMEVLLMAPQVIGEITDALAQDRHLDLRRSGVTLLGGILNDERLLALGGDGHRFTPSAIDDPRRLETAVFDLGQSDHRSVVPSADNRALVEPVQMRLYASVQWRYSLPATQSNGFGCGQGQSRDIVQRGLDWKQILRSGQTMPTL